MRAVVIAKTKMGENICVGAADLESGSAMRLIPADGAEFHSWREFRPSIGSIIELTGSPSRKTEPPHTEDILVVSWNDTNTRIDDISNWIRKNCNVWHGNRSSLFDGVMQFTQLGKGQILRNRLPSSSVGFWVTPRDLVYYPETNRYAYAGALPVNARYVGLEEASENIPANSLVRVSLARWWKPEGSDMPEACWLQISGYYS